MNQAMRVACVSAFLLTLGPGGLMAQTEDVADVPANEQRVGGDENKRYLLIQREEAAPERGYGLVVVLPGGDGSDNFSPFVRRILKNALPPGYLIAEPIAPLWSEKQQVTWPTAS